MAVIVPSEQGGTPLDLIQGESFFKGFWRSSLSVTIAADILTLPGSGRYKVLPQTGTSDQIVSLVLSSENVEGALVQLRPETVGHTLTLIHGATLKLPNEQNAVLPTIYSTIWLRHYGSGVFAAESPVMYTA